MAALVRTAVRPFVAAGARRTMAIDAKLVRFERFGAPQNVLSVATETLSEDLKANQVLVQMVAAPITPNDFHEIKGFSSSGSTGVAGNEGLGKVLSTGSGVADLAKDDFVVPAAAGFGTWRTHAVVDRAAVTRVDTTGVSDEVASAAIVAPGTAQRLLTDFVDLEEGDVIIQNNAASTVGQAVVQYAAARGIKTINIARSRDNWEDFVNHLHGHGATIVVTDEFARTPDFTKLIADLGAPKLALNSVGGRAATVVASTLGEDGTLVSFGGMASSSVDVPLSALVEKNITVRGFSFAKWFAAASPAEREELVAKCVDDARENRCQVLLAREPFGDFEYALKRSLQAGEPKVVLVM